MKRHMHKSVRPPVQSARRGTAAVEFAVVLPFLAVLLLGIVEIGRALEVSHLLNTSVREGARFGAMDKEGILQEGQTANQKIEADIKNFLAAAGVPLDQVTVQIQTVPEDSNTEPTTFDFDDPANELKLFKITVEVPYSAVSIFPAHYLSGKSLTANVVFRNSRATLVN